MLNSVTVVFAAVLAKYLYRDWPEKNWTHFFNTFLLLEASPNEGHDESDLEKNLWYSKLSMRFIELACFEIVGWFKLFSTNVRIWSEPEKLIDCHALNSVSTYVCNVLCMCNVNIYSTCSKSRDVRSTFKWRV